MNGRDVYVVGGGTSLEKFQFSRLYDKDVIAVNMAIFNIPTAKHFITMDYTFLRKSGVQGSSGATVKGPKWQYFCSIPARKHFVIGIPEQDRKKIDEKHYVDLNWDLHYRLDLFDNVIEVAGYGGMGTTFDGFQCGSESGYSGLQLAVVLGYTNIHLLGFDFYCDGKRTHFHKRYVPQAEYQKTLDSYCSAYLKPLMQLKELGVNVYSHSEKSKLNDWIPYLPLEDV